ncbi:MAG: 50S ribosomal protein L18 [SAR324 cluster bacterium]|nr:50S ribosomal protein L18 [SAR324 cluster bacterium]
MKKTAKRLIARKHRQKRVRRKIFGTEKRPRLAVFRSAKHIYVQAIDDEQGKTLAAASTVDKGLQESISGCTGNKTAAGVVGKAIAERLLEKSVSSVVFDRGGFMYHGRVQALADAAREAGLSF